MVLADGCFDPLHVGHVRYLDAARDLAEWPADLIVNVASDDEIRRKGREPFQTLPERMEMLRKLCGEVISEPLNEAIRTRKPRYLVKGIEWMGRIPPYILKACEDSGTTLVFTHTRVLGSSERLSGVFLSSEFNGAGFTWKA